MLCIRGPHSLSHGLLLVHGLLGTRLQSRRWVAGEQAKLPLLHPIFPHCSHYYLNHPPPLHTTCRSGKIVFCETDHWCQKVWGLLLYITFIDLQMLVHPFDPGINPTWSWCMILFIYCWIQFTNILLRIFASIFIKDIGLYTMENSMELPQKTKNRATIWPCNHTPGHLSREKHDPKGYMHPNVHCSTVYNSQDIEATEKSIDRGRDKEDVVHICNFRILLNHWKE